MLVILPFVTFIIIFFFIKGSKVIGPGVGEDWRGGVLRTTLLWGVAVVVITEGLNLFEAITPLSLSLSWLALGVIFLIAGLRSGCYTGVGDIRNFRCKPDVSIDRTLQLFMIVMAGILFAIAILSPSNNLDSLQYHMPRITQWAQNQSLAFFPSTFTPQLFNPIWAELAILNLRSLAGSDWPVNLIQWLSMVLSLLGVMQIVKILGGTRRAELLAGVFAFSIPIGILEATSTQTDYATTLWFICMLFLVVLSMQRRLSIPEIFLSGAAIGLGCLTKTTFYLFALPVLIWFGFSLLRKNGFRPTLQRGILISTVVIALNAGYWLRNFELYHFPLGPASFVQGRSAQNRSVQGFVMNGVQHVMHNFATPVDTINNTVEGTVQRISEFVGAGSHRMELIWSWNYEDLAGNPIHILLFLATIPILIQLQRKKKIKLLIARLGWILIASFSVLILFLGSNPMAMRYHLPFVVAWGILFGLVVDRIFKRSITVLVACLLLLMALPYVLLNQTRPFIGLQPRTATASILREDASVTLFANTLLIREAYVGAARAVQRTNCTQVALRIDSHDPEYSLWWLLEAPQSGIQLRHLEYADELKVYADPEFDPCIILCTICSRGSAFEGFIPYQEFDDFYTYIKPDYLPLE